jgi:RNA polymerase sigma factor (sigma-70 family)
MFSALEVRQNLTSSHLHLQRFCRWYMSILPWEERANLVQETLVRATYILSENPELQFRDQRHIDAWLEESLFHCYYCKHYMGYVHHLCQQYLYSAYDRLPDAVQETFRRFIRNAQTRHISDSSHLKNLLRSCAQSACLDIMRSNTPDYHEDDSLTMLADRVNPTASFEGTSLIMILLSELPDAENKVIHHMKLQRHTLQETASQLNMTIEQVRYAQRQGINRLRQKLEEASHV